MFLTDRKKFKISFSIKENNWKCLWSNEGTTVKKAKKKTTRALS